MGNETFKIFKYETRFLDFEFNKGCHIITSKKCFFLKKWAKILFIDKFAKQFRKKNKTDV